MNKKLIAQTNQGMSMPFKNNPINIYYKQYRDQYVGGRHRRKTARLHGEED